MSEHVPNDAQDEPITTGQSSPEPAEGDISPGEQQPEAPQGQSSEQDTTG